jgi:hypothetical protein
LFSLSSETPFHHTTLHTGTCRHAIHVTHICDPGLSKYYCFQDIPRSTFSSTEGFCGNVLLPPWQCTNLLTNSRVPSRYSDSSGSTTTLNYSSC